jgi:hypothetical protein
MNPFYQPSALTLFYGHNLSWCLLLSLCDTQDTHHSLFYRLGISLFHQQMLSSVILWNCKKPCFFSSSWVLILTGVWVYLCLYSLIHWLWCWHKRYLYHLCLFSGTYSVFCFLLRISDGSMYSRLSGAEKEPNLSRQHKKALKKMVCGVSSASGRLSFMEFNILENP